MSADSNQLTATPSVPRKEDTRADPFAVAPRFRWWATVNFRATVLAIGLFVGMIALWSWLANSGTVSPLILAPPEDVVAALQRMIADGSLWPNLRATVIETSFGFIAAIVSAMTISFLFVFSEALRRAVYPYLVIIQTFPKVAIAPIVIAALGYGMAPKIVLAALMAFFPILVNAMVGLTSISEDQENLLRSVRASGWQKLTMLRIPNALSYILPGLNTSAVLALIGTIVAEFVSAREGIGFAIQSATQTGAVDVTYALLIVLGGFGTGIWLILTILGWSLRRYRF